MIDPNLDEQIMKYILVFVIGTALLYSLYFNFKN